MKEQDIACRGVHTLLRAHSGKVNAVRFLSQPDGRLLILSGSVDKDIQVWVKSTVNPRDFDPIGRLEGHNGSVNCISVLPRSHIGVSGAADGTLRTWDIRVESKESGLTCIQNISTNPRFFPLATSLCRLDHSGALLMAAGGTKNALQLFISHESEENVRFVHVASLSGHDGWIRSLDFIDEKPDYPSDILLASASQDKQIRLWRVQQSRESVGRSSSVASQNPDTKLDHLSNKAHSLSTHETEYSATFEALLLGHEDWIYTASWNRHENGTRLLSASADNSLAIWEAEKSSGIWTCNARIGELSAQKGSTTATGSFGGFWAGLWSPNGDHVASIGRTGSWRIWKYQLETDSWAQRIGISGPTKESRGVSWAKDGSYLLSISADQTTRLYARSKLGDDVSWHEFARPQIHGYDLNCIDTIGKSRFVSGADEKLLRVFDKPWETAVLLERLCGLRKEENRQMPEVAHIPVLGLSNKADREERSLDQPDAEDNNFKAADPHPVDHPPFEDILSRRTLWPEMEKLYGHGYEISAVAASYGGDLIATACRASSLEHAVIRLYETQEWREIRPALVAHSLTVTCLRFNRNDHYLLSVGRDRQWTVFARDDSKGHAYPMFTSKPKAHSRMILGAGWGPASVREIFATAGRDKSIKLWSLAGADFQCCTTISLTHAATTLDFHQSTTLGALLLASGMENGALNVYKVDSDNFNILESLNIDHR